jgi:hypothetical protein
MSPLNLAVTIGPSICKRKEANMKSEMTDMSDHNQAFEVIIREGTSISDLKEDLLKFYACTFLKPGTFPLVFFVAFFFAFVLTELSGVVVGSLKENSLLFVSRKNEKGKLEIPEEGNGMPKYGSVYCEDILTGIFMYLCVCVCVWYVGECGFKHLSLRSIICDTCGKYGHPFGLHISPSSTTVHIIRFRE